MTTQLHRGPNGGLYQTRAAGRMMDSIDTAWDSLTPYTLTAEAGELAEPDADALRKLCDEEGEDFAAAHAEVMDLIRNQVEICR